MLHPYLYYTLILKFILKQFYNINSVIYVNNIRWNKKRCININIEPGTRCHERNKKNKKDEYYSKMDVEIESVWIYYFAMVAIYSSIDTKQLT
jgi:hypothetical protein